MRKKISLLLVFFMLFTMLPMAGFAEEDVDFIGETLVEAVSPEEGTDPEAGEEASPGIEPGEEEPEVEPGPALEPEETEPEEDPEAEPLPGETVTEPEEEEVTLEPEIEEIEPEVRPEEVLAAPLAATFGLDEEPELSNNFYQLKSKEDLFWFAEKLNQSPDEKINGELLGDIDLENEKWTPIEKLNGEFNGNSYTIKNLLVEETTYSQGFIKENYGIVRNFTLEGSVTSNKHSLGAVAGKNFGIISDIENYAEIINNGSYSNAKYIGGIAGTNEGTIFRVSNYANIMIEGNIIGGIVGLEEGTIYSAANYGNIKSRTGFSDYAGGIVGAINMNKKSTIYNVFNQGKVEGGIKGKAGGVAGYLQSNAILSLSNAYNTGELTAAEKNPMSPGGTLNNTYYLSDETDWDSGKVSAEDFKKNEIIEKLNKDDNELEVNDKDKFVFTKDTYPTLRWQGMESPSTPEEPSEIKELREAAEGLKVTVKNTSTELPYLVTDSDWIKLIDHGPNNDYSIDVSWKSSNNDLISISSGIGSIKLPETGEAEVTLTATLSKSGYSLDKEFKYILTKNKPELSEDEIYLEEAIKSLEWYKLNTNSDKDENLTLFLKEVLNAKQYSDINVSIKSSSREDLVELDGKINYIFDEAYLKTGLPYDRKAELIFDFTKGEAKKEYSTFIMVDWDRSKVREAIERNIVDPLSQNLIGDNEAFDQIKVDFQVPGMREYTRITWETSDASFLRVEPGQLPIDPSNIKVIRGEVDKNLVLTAKVVYNRDDTIMVEKEYHFTILALNDANELVAEMQTLLDENYTLDKLKNYTNKEIIDANDIKDDISLIKPKDTGIKDYDNYKFEVTSDGDDILIKGFRAHVYRPLPGQNAKEATLTIKMIHKDKGVTVEKSIPIKISPLVQDDIDAEISLMELVKEKYFEAIKGENTDADSIESNLKAFREVNLVNGSLQWTYHIDDDKDTGIYADEIKGAESQEQWRLFRSSRPEIIKHENLIVYKPEYTTKVNIESALSSRQYGKYAEKYPDVDDFKKLYKQPVLITLTVIGENDEIKDEVKTLDVNTAIVVFKENGDYEIKSVPQEVKIEKDKHDGGLTVFGALQATTNEYIGSGSWVTSIYGITGPTTTGGWMFTVNGQVPEYPAGQVILKEGDKVIWYCTYDYQRDQAPSWEELTKTEPEEDALAEITERVKKVIIDSDDKFEYTTVMGLRLTGVAAEDIADKAKTYGSVYFTNNNNRAKNIIMDIALGRDAQANTEELLKQNFYDESTLEPLVNSIIALDIVEADYDKNRAIGNLVEKLKTNASVKENALSLIALSKNRDIGEVEESITLAKSRLKDAQDENALINNCETHSYAIQGLLALGEDIESSYWVKENSENEKITLLDALIGLEVDGEFRPTYAADWPKSGQEIFAYPALVDISLNKSMYHAIKDISPEIPGIKDKFGIKIISPNNETNLHVEETVKLDVEILKNDELFEGEKELVWSSSNDQIISVDNTGLVKAHSIGEASILVEIKDTDIKATLNFKVLAKTPEIIGENTLNTFIEAIKDYYDKIHFVENQGSLDAFETATLTRAGVDLSKWVINKEATSKYDVNLEYLANKAKQVQVMLDFNENPTTYKDRNLVQEIIDLINKDDYGNTDQNYLNAVFAVDRYNKKYASAKINYLEETVIGNILKSQNADGGFKERGDESVPINSGYALRILANHKDFVGVETSIANTLSYLKGIQKDDGGFYIGTYVTTNNAEIVSSLLLAGEDLTSEKWKKGTMNPIESLFVLWKDNNSFDNMKGESENNKGWVPATQKSLYTILDLVERGYSDYVVQTKMIGEIPDVVEETLEVYTAIVTKGQEGYKFQSAPKGVTINTKEHNRGLTALGALQATTPLYEETSGWVTSIYGIENQGLNGWVYTVNDIMPNTSANNVTVEKDDKIIWFYSTDGMEGKIPSWEELTKTEPEEVTLDSIIASLRSHYAAKSEFAFREAIGYNYTSDNLENDLSLIAAKIKVKEAATTSSDLAGNVISIISAGQDPFSYQGVNYVEKLDQAFNKNDWPTSSAFRMLALDMAQADYNRVEAIKTFVDGQDDEGKWGGSYAGPDEVGMVITALAKYKDQAPVQEAIDKGLVYLKGAQDSDTGGFIVWGSENPYSASAVIQGLIAVGEDPSAEKWTKNGKSITDSLLSFYVDGKIVDDKGAEVPMLTEQAFIALADLQKGKSMFNEIKFGSGQDGKEQLTIKIISDKTSIKVDEQLELKAEVYQDNNLVTDKEIVWTSSDVAIANIDDNGLVTGKKQGEVSIRAAIEGTEIHKILALTVVGGGGSTTDPEKPTLQSVDILIKGYSGTILNKNNVKINENESLLNLTIRLLEENNISYENRNGYIASINGEKEFDKGKDSGWMVSVNGEFPQVGAASVILKDKDIVQWLYTYDLGEDIGGGTGGGGAAKPPTTAEPNLAPKVPVKEGSATATITTADINKAIEEIKKDSSKALVISPEITGQATKVSVEIAKESTTAILNETKADLKVETPVGNLNIPQAALKEIAAAAGSNGIAITVESVETSKLTAEQKELVKESPVFDISIKTGDKNISSFNGKEITISLPYTLKADEKASDVKVWYLNDKGQLEEMKCTYDEKTGLATFTTNHLSKFMVGVEVAEVKPVPVATISFTDVSAADWFYDAVKFAVEKGLFKGTSENTFSPNQATTRAMVVSVLHRLSGEPAGYKSSFTDVNENDWFVEPVAWAAANNVVSGYGQGLFGPNDQVTREQLAGILHRYAQSKGYELTKTKDLSGYKDASAISPWAKEVIAWANAEGLINGRSADLLAPGESATRAEVAAILQRFIENIMK